LATAAASSSVSGIVGGGSGVLAGSAMGNAGVGRVALAGGVEVGTDSADAVGAALIGGRRGAKKAVPPSAVPQTAQKRAPSRLV
jgi:hypothetical protein